MKFFTAAISSLVLVSAAPLRGQDNAVAIAGSIQNANVAVLRFDNSIQTIDSGNQANVGASIRLGTDATNAVLQASNDVSQTGRVDPRSAPQVQQAMTGFVTAMNKVADDLVQRRNAIQQSQQGGTLVQLYVSQANAGMQLMSTAMQDIPPRERNMAAEALATIPNGMDKVIAAFGLPPPNNAPNAGNNGNQNAQGPTPPDGNNNGGALSALLPGAGGNGTSTNSGASPSSSPAAGGGPLSSLLPGAAGNGTSTSSGAGASASPATNGDASSSGFTGALGLARRLVRHRT